MELLHPDNRKVLAFLREYEDQTILVVANLSRFAQFAELDLRGHRGRTPVELFGRTRFPPIGEEPYFFTLGPQTFYWFLLADPPESEREMEDGPPLPALRVGGSWRNVLTGRIHPSVLSALELYFKRTRWFGGKARPVSGVQIGDAVFLETDGLAWAFVLASIEYREGEPESFLLPLAFLEGSPQDHEVDPREVVATLMVEEEKDAPPLDGFLYEPVTDRRLAEALVDLMGRALRLKGEEGSIQGEAYRTLDGVWSPGDDPLPESAVLDSEQSNTSIRFGHSMILKLFRKVDRGVNPELEVGRFLTEKTDFRYFPRMLGALEYHPPRGETSTLGILQEYLANEGDAWRFTLDVLQRYWERCLSLAPEEREAPDIPPASTLVSGGGPEPDERIQTLLGPAVSSLHELGRITGEMHLALASDPEVQAFAPEPAPPHYARSLYQSVRSQARGSLDLLRQMLPQVPPDDREPAERLVGRSENIRQEIRRLTGKEIAAKRIRCHGDYHLGQVLYTGREFMVIDFEGEPARSISERRLKRSPLRDVAGMLRSLHYASVFGLLHGEAVRSEDLPVLEPWARVWYYWMSGAFLKTYLETVKDAAFLPATEEGRGALLRILLFEKGAYELRYELNNRPDWIRVPVQGLLDLLGNEGKEAP